jgi:hypothetical protein
MTHPENILFIQVTKNNDIKYKYTVSTGDSRKTHRTVISGGLIRVQKLMAYMRRDSGANTGIFQNGRVLLLSFYRKWTVLTLKINNV